MDVLMKCGHSANATQVLKDGTKIPVCVICNCKEVVEEKPSLEGRKAKCSYYGKEVDRRNNETYYPEMMTKNYRGKDCCGSIVDSDFKLPFFHLHPNKEYDEFYCGCQSWN